MTLPIIIFDKTIEEDNDGYKKWLNWIDYFFLISDSTYAPKPVKVIGEILDCSYCIKQQLKGFLWSLEIRKDDDFIIIDEMSFGAIKVITSSQEFFDYFSTVFVLIYDDNI